MKKSRFTDSQTMDALKRVESAPLVKFFNNDLPPILPKNQLIIFRYAHLLTSG